jgi:3',5'-cyclic AMP phosphodiesterase CpdA
VLAHLSDPHIGGTDGVDPERDLAAAVARVLELGVPLDALLITGDLAEHGDVDEYRRVARLVAPLDVPVLALCGNHDQPAAMRAVFDAVNVPGTPTDGPVRYAAEVGGMRLIACHTAVPGHAGGALDAEQLAWLDATLAAEPVTPTLVAMHHPPVTIGMPFLDAIALRRSHVEGLESVLSRHRQVRRVVCGHAHLTAISALGEVPVLVCPSTWQTRARLRLHREGYELEQATAGVVLHALIDGDITSHVQPVGSPQRVSCRAVI